MTKGRTSLDYCSFLHCCDSAFLDSVLCKCVWSSIGCVLSAHRNDAPFDDPVPYLLTNAPAHSAQRRRPCKRRQRDAARCPIQRANCRRECTSVRANDDPFDAATGRTTRAATYARGTRPKHVRRPLIIVPFCIVVILLSSTRCCASVCGVASAAC